MTKSAAHDEPIVLSADADPLDDLFDRPKDGAGAKGRPSGGSTRSNRPSGGGFSSFLIATAASFVWIAAVAAFCWSRYSLPDNPGDAMSVVGSRISTGDWMLIVAAILGPLLFIWIVAWLMRRIGDLKRQSQDLASAAMRLTHAAQTAEAAGRPLALSGVGEVTGETPRHLRREVERATHAISALHSQMRAIEEALSTQARNIDDVAERAEKRARVIANTLRTEREALERVSDETGGSMAVSPAALGSVGTGLAAAGLGAAAVSGLGNDDGYQDSLDANLEIDAPSDVTDFALDEARVEAAAESDASDLLSNAPTFAREAEENAVTQDSSAVVEDLRSRLAQAKANARWEKPALPDMPEPGILHAAPDAATEPAEIIPEAVDPFDDLGAKERDDTESQLGHGATLGAAAATAVGGAAMTAMADEEPPAPDFDAPQQAGSVDYQSLDHDRIDETKEGPFKLERRHNIDWTKFTRAANFPESEEDIETLDALYDVLTDPEAASLLQCAEDTLASLADIDLYMEDFTPRLVPVVAWKSHLDGSGGDAIDGINAPVEQSRIRAKLGTDKGFEHLCAKFMDRYEDMGRRLMQETDDQKLIVDLSNTRTGRAYLMISAAAGRLTA